MNETSINEHMTYIEISDIFDSELAKITDCFTEVESYRKFENSKIQGLKIC